MPGRECYHCKQWIEAGEEHDCWTTTEAALTRGLSEDLREAWARLRETAAAFGEQRIYASHKSIMFSRKSCYFFVRPKQAFLEVCVFLGREVKAPQIRRVDRASKSKLVHSIRITHRDEVEAPLTDWLQEAYEMSKEVRRTSTETNRSKSGPAPKLDSGKQLVRLRRICLSIPGAVEKLSHGEPTFFTPKRVFAMFANNHHGDGHIAAWLPGASGVQAALIEEDPEAYFRPPYVGVKGWVGVELAKLDDEQLGALIREAFRFVDPKAMIPSTKPAQTQRASATARRKRG